MKNTGEEFLMVQINLKNLIKIDPILLLIVVLSAVLYLYNLDSYPFNPDEATYTSQANIWAGNDQYRENFIQYSRSATNFQIHQIIMSVFIKIYEKSNLELTEIMYRIPTVIFGLLTIVLIYLLAETLFNRRAALLSALFGGINGYSLHFNRLVNIDTTLVFFMMLSIFTIVKWRITKNNNYFYLFLISTILAVISKVIIIIPLIAIVYVYLYIQKDIDNGIKMLFKPQSILIILAGLMYIFYFIILIAGIKEYTQTLLYASERESKNIAFFYIQVVVTLLGYILPIIALVGIAKGLKYRTEGDILYITWFVFMLLFFTYYPVQAYNYMLPIIPAIALLAGRATDSIIDDEIAKKPGIGMILVPIIILAGIYPTFGALYNPDELVGDIAPIRFDSIKYDALKDASLWLKDNAKSDSNVAIYTFADNHIVSYYSGLKTYTIKNYPGYYSPPIDGSIGNAKINWNTIDVINMIENGKIDYIIYMNEPRLAKNLSKLYEVEGLDFSPVYQKNYMTPEWYRNSNLSISIYKVEKITSMKMNNISKNSFTILVLPDTQEYSRIRPDIFKNQTLWIKENIDTLNIKFVVQTGDIVDIGNSENQWTRANKIMGILDGIVPYLVVPGNHDYNGLVSKRDKTSYNKYFNYTRFENDSKIMRSNWYGGHYPPNGNENNYGLFSSTDGEFLLMGLDYCPNDDALVWANNTINKYPDRKVVLFTHAYLNSQGERITPGERNSCSANGLVGNEGEDIWNKLVKNHKNIILVLSGHKFGNGKKVDYIEDYPINQIINNYQTFPNGGNGYLRLYTFVPEEKRIDVKTYSPYLNQYNMEPDSQFNLTYKD